MRALKLFLCLSIFLVFMFGFGCEKRDAFSLTDIEWILVMIGDYSNIFHDNLFDTQVDASGSPGSPSFYREITFRQTYEDSIIISDTLVPGFLVANVWETDSIEGIFHVYDGTNWYDNAFVAKSTMRAYLEKWGDAGDPYNGWIIKGLTQIITYSIISFSPYFNLNVTSSGGGVNYNYISTDNSMMELSSFPLTLSVGDTAYLHLTSIDKTNYVYLHYYDGSTLKKVRFTDSGTTLDAQFVVNGQPGTYRHFFIDIVDDGSVGPPPQNYRARTWGILYKIQ